MAVAGANQKEVILHPSKDDATNTGCPQPLSLEARMDLAKVPTEVTNHDLVSLASFIPRKRFLEAVHVQNKRLKSHGELHV